MTAPTLDDEIAAIQRAIGSLTYARAALRPPNPDDVAALAAALARLEAMAVAADPDCADPPQEHQP